MTNLSLFVNIFFTCKRRSQGQGRLFTAAPPCNVYCDVRIRDA